MLSVLRAQCILYMIGQLLVKLVVVRGDLEIVIKFIICGNKVKNSELAAMVQEVQELVKLLRA